jgi:hypothetical protein
MKKMFVLVLAFCISFMALMAAAEEEYGFYADENPEAAPYVSTWVAEDGYWRIESYDEDGGIKLQIVHVLGDNKADVWEYSAALNQEKWRG